MYIISPQRDAANHPLTVSGHLIPFCCLPVMQCNHSQWELHQAHSLPLVEHSQKVERWGEKRELLGVELSHGQCRWKLFLPPPPVPIAPADCRGSQTGCLFSSFRPLSRPAGEAVRREGGVVKRSGCCFIRN